MSQFCISCGIENSEEAKFCKSCGQKLKTEEYAHFDKKVNNHSPDKNDNTSNENNNFGSKALKTIFAILVSIIILMVASVIFQLMKTGFVDVGQNIHNSYGTIGTFIFVIFKMSPLIIGIWLVKISWKKITS